MPRPLPGCHRAQANLKAILFPIDLLLNQHLNNFQASDQVKIYMWVIRTTSLIDVYQRNLKNNLERKRFFLNFPVFVFFNSYGISRRLVVLITCIYTWFEDENGLNDDLVTWENE